MRQWELHLLQSIEEATQHELTIEDDWVLSPGPRTAQDLLPWPDLLICPFNHLYVCRPSSGLALGPTLPSIVPLGGVGGTGWLMILLLRFQTWFSECPTEMKGWRGQVWTGEWMPQGHPGVPGDKICLLPSHPASFPSIARWVWDTRMTQCKNRTRFKVKTRLLGSPLGLGEEVFTPSRLWTPFQERPEQQLSFGRYSDSLRVLACLVLLGEEFNPL